MRLVKSSAPGRICLFGEHQDYLGFPVIAAGVDLTVDIDGRVSEGHHVDVELPDMGTRVSFDTRNIQYSGKKDYLKSVVKVLKEKGLYEERRIEAVLKGNVPIQAGTSSSAAFVVAWTRFVLKASGFYCDRFLKNPAEIGELAYLAEVREFGESGGRMDQYASAVGGIVYLDFHESHDSGGKMKVTPLPPGIKEFVLGDSHQPKDTQKTLKRVRTAQEEAFRELAGYIPIRDNFHVTYEAAEPYLNKISAEKRPYLRAALMNHKITDEARDEFLSESPDVGRIADLMNRHQGFLRDDLKVSTAKIDAMIEESMEAGALAGKINGSGEGGCMFAFCPGKQEAVAEAIKRSGGTPYIINIGENAVTD
jgi:galactokinase